MSGKTRHARRSLRRSKKQNKRSRKLQRGGVYLGEGSYGCVFGMPPLKCIGEPTRLDNRFITKAMTSEDTINEINDAKKFKLIDPEKQYFIWPERSCDIDTTDLTPEDNIKKCTLLKTKRINKLLVSYNGGENLAKIKPRFEDYSNLFESLLNLFDGLHLAHTNNIAHCDIKPANIVSMKTDDGSYNTRFIDFGLSKQTDTIERGVDFEMFRQPYPYWPLETRFYGTYFINNELSREQSVTGLYDALSIYIDLALPRKTYYKINEVPRYTEADLKIVLNNLDLTKGSDALKSLDVFSLGITLASIYYKFIPHIIKYKTDGSLYSEIPIKLYLASEPNFTDVIQWHIDVQNKISIPIANLIYEMVHIVPMRRPSALAAKEKYEAILPAIRELFTWDKLYVCLKPTGVLGELPNPPTPNNPSPVNFSRIQVSPVNAPSQSNRSQKMNTLNLKKNE